MDTYIENFNILRVNDKLITLTILTKTLTENKEETFTVLHNNIRSVSKDFDEFKVLINPFIDQME